MKLLKLLNVCQYCEAFGWNAFNTKNNYDFKPEVSSIKTPFQTYKPKTYFVDSET